MLKTWTGILALVALLAGCTGFGPTPRDTSAVRIEGSPGMGVIYLVRPNPDLSYLTTPVTLNDRMIGSTYAGTYFRLEVPAGRHRLSGFAQDTGAITVDVQADRVYFVHHKVSGSWRANSPHSFFQLIDEQRARGMMAGASRAS